MVSESSDERYLPGTVKRSTKILVVGSFGVGKTTLIGSVSEIVPLRTEETMTVASMGVDDLAGLQDKMTTTVAMDFGRITLNPSVVLYLFGTPGQRRFWDLWDGLADGAAGALVLVDTRRLEGSFEVLDQLELRKDGLRHTAEELRQALDLLPETPIVFCDARDRHSSVEALIALTAYALAAQEGSL
jgi:signal recognition particle receptor subunit beta